MAAAQQVFTNYRLEKTDNTLRRQLADLNSFAEYLTGLGHCNAGDLQLTGETLATKSTAWSGMTWGLIEGFKRWMLLQGYAVGSVNVRLSTVKTYAKLAEQSGVINSSEGRLICQVHGHGRKASRSIDGNRAVTRLGHKKAEAVVLTNEATSILKAQPDTPQGRRDALLMCLMLDHGLRVGEVVILMVGDIDLTGELRFYRPKVDKRQTHRLTPDTRRAAERYMLVDRAGANPEESLWRASLKDASLHNAGLTEQAVTERVRRLGQRIGVQKLSAHDLRHTWATRAARAGTDPFKLQEAGGWASLAMPRHYVESAKIANAGVRLE